MIKENLKSIYIGFDFSINKPAATILIDNKYYFLCWPLDVDNKTIQKLENTKILVHNRERIKFTNNSTNLMSHDLECSVLLAEMIIKDIKSLLETKGYNESNCNIKIANEGFSFNSKGNSQLKIDGYKYILMDRLSKFTSSYLLFTYAPQTIKSIAGCAKKGMSSKEYMINSFLNENIEHDFYYILKTDDSKLRKKKNFIECIDDIVDSYFVLKTLLKYEN